MSSVPPRKAYSLTHSLTRWQSDEACYGACTFNDVVVMLTEVNVIPSPFLTTKKLLGVYVRVTKNDNPVLLPQLHTNNNGCDLTFHEFLEMLAHVALMMVPKLQSAVATVSILWTYYP